MAPHQTARSEFQHELEELELQTLGGLDLVRDQLLRVTRALEQHDIALAREVVADDDKVDALFFELHDHLLSVLALQAPVAGDLRLAAALLHIARLIERMGDQCVNVAKLIPLDGRHPRVHPVLLEELGVMGRLAADEVMQAKQAFLTRDLGLARELVHRDRDVNEINRRVFQFAWECGDDPEAREWAMHMVLASRAIERIGDQCVDVGEQLGFVVTGRFEEFRDASHPLPDDGATAS
jgi:phosphate transport system protein